MKAVLVDERNQNLFIDNVKEPIPKEGELLVKIKATAINRADLLQRKGLYPPPPGAPTILGLEMAGVVEKVGTGVSSWKEGDCVSALLPGGGYAEKVVIPADMGMRIPETMSFEQAAAIPEAFLTAYLNLVEIGQLTSGEHVLIHAGASGVGTAAIQISKEIGATSIVTAGSDEKLQRCSVLGANYIVNYKEADFSEKVQKVTNGKGVQLILDFVGASYWDRNIRSIGVDGRWILVGSLGGREVSNVNLGPFLQKRLQFVGSTLRSRTTAFKIELTRKFEAFSKEKFSNGSLAPIIDRVFDWHDVADAHRYMESNQNIGKIVLKVK
ncbi:NAD(P)H-quinone oxidoreductase [Neobacillus vireti]|uniref:NAD(P)H quinone oxidoreductase n=1 Tax=Neobacillus vireti LMG 21834 TaxID=1131730 RepID=A0AB94IPK8_9BACI|nr:NAD(P)H-quinone oxidoreductase [Neobacillus vireti]ETI69041.1 NAD(P)H quinone oxidoreductase [Neobacillus vireti LMG 21834]KLT15678.1 NADPH:quinone oxidoreductase [Neobacillus vireti]